MTNTATTTRDGHMWSATTTIDLTEDKIGPAVRGGHLYMEANMAIMEVYCRRCNRAYAHVAGRRCDSDR